VTIKAQVIADSISPEGVRLTTMQLRYPRFIHAEFMTHRQFSRNASSSRAIPVAKLVEDVVNDPVYPSFWGANQKGMQANEECSAPIEVDHPMSREMAWDVARGHAIMFAKAFANAGYHKQIVNRLLEPFSHINVVCTATEWSNFFALRDHSDAQPEIRQLAKEMRDRMEWSIPQGLDYDEWHLPYVIDEERYDRDIAIKCSVARCARVSYLTYERKKPNIEEDLKLYDRLLGAQPIHASPSEHQATPGDRDSGNFRGWRQYRKMIPGECQ
jgi:thymidylate synthase ThyX